MMKRLAILLIIIFSLQSVAMLQTIHPTGLILDDAAYSRLPYASENIQIESGQRFSASQMDLSRYCPEVGDQGDIFSCVGWATGYGAMTIERAVKNGWTDKRKITEHANSALFIYNQISDGECNQGIEIPKTLMLAQEKGNCLAREYDEDVNNCTMPITPELLKSASNYKIAEYIRLFEPDEIPEEKIRKVKLILAQKKPVITGLIIRQNFKVIPKGISTWWTNIGDTGYAGGHCMVAVGYDDNKYRNSMHPPEQWGAIKLMNSWGKDWGENGFIWIKYEDFANYCPFACAIMMEYGNPINLDYDPSISDQTREDHYTHSETQTGDLKRLSGLFGFRYVSDWDDENSRAIFDEAKVRLIGNNHYQLEGTWSIGTQFQLYTRSGFDNGYIYVLSVDGAGKAEVHFPRSQEYNPKFEGKNESALIMSSGSILTIPEENKGLELGQVGKDQLIVLFSTKKINANYIHFLSIELSSNKENLPERLEEILNKYLVPSEKINYKTNQMGFEVSTKSGERIIPIVLTVEVSP